MSNYFSESFSINYLFIIHKESKGIIFICYAQGVEFDPRFVEDIRQAIQSHKAEIPQTDGDITQRSFKNKYIIMRAGKMTYSILVINNQPNRFTRETLHSYVIRVECRWGLEIRDFYDKFNGDINIFLEDTETRLNLLYFTREVFHTDFISP